MTNTNAKIAMDKEKHPERYCPQKGCLWKTTKLNHMTNVHEGGGYCPRHRKPSKYTPYPGSNWDYSVTETARMALHKPNKSICIYCHGQAATDSAIIHQDDCPARNEREED
jgi:hypothetical protein